MFLARIFIDDVKGIKKVTCGRVQSLQRLRLGETALPEKRATGRTCRITASDIAVEPSHATVIAWLLRPDELWDPLEKTSAVD